jgi:hypothetical protein
MGRIASVEKPVSLVTAAYPWSSSATIPPFGSICENSVHIILGDASVPIAIGLVATQDCSSLDVVGRVGSSPQSVTRLPSTISRPTSTRNWYHPAGMSGGRRMPWTALPDMTPVPVSTFSADDGVST